MPRGNVRAEAAEAKAAAAAASARPQIANSREHRGSRAPFCPTTVLRDLLVRQTNLSSGAANVRKTTRLYSSMIGADGEDVGLESGSERSILDCRRRA